MQAWTADNEDSPPPRWLVYGLALAAGVALVSLIAMAAWLVLVLVPRNWPP